VTVAGGHRNQVSSGKSDPFRHSYAGVNARIQMLFKRGYGRAGSLRTKHASFRPTSRLGAIRAGSPSTLLPSSRSRKFNVAFYSPSDLTSV
jgi:hypothetical protein